MRAVAREALINAIPRKGRGGMGHCLHCGAPFPRTRKTRKYCTNRCKTNACLDKKPRLKAADIAALQSLLCADFPSLDALREELRSIVAPSQPAIPLVDGRAAVPRLD
jgi:predicted nucleic acid-binding Zn ribbon protein